MAVVRWLGSLALGVAMLVVCSTSLAADTYPTKPVKVIVPTGVGTPWDSRVRMVAELLARRLGQPVLVENKPGAGGTLAAAFVANAAPDGYTLLAGTIADQSIAPAVYEKLPYDPRKSFAPITMAVRASPILVVNASLGVSDMKDLLALARAKPAQLSFGTYGNGTLTHLLLLQLNQMARIELVHVPYKNAADALTDVVGGQIAMMYDYVPTVGPFIKSGKLNAVMVVGPTRLKALANVPAAPELGFSTLTHRGWSGFLAPMGTPREVILRLNSDLVQVLRSQEITRDAERVSTEIVANSPEEFAQYIRSEQEALAQLATTTGARIR